MTKLSFFNIVNQSPEKAVIEIDGTIGGWDWDDWCRVNTGKLIRKELKKIDQAKNIEVHITSLGGDVDEAFQIHDALKDHPAEVTTIVNGFCASAATIIALAGDKRKISKNSVYLIHKCSSYASGNEHDLEMELESQKTVNGIIYNMYKNVCVKSEEELEALFNYNNGNGKWLKAEEVVAFGFCDEIYNQESSIKVATADQSLISMLNYPALPNHPNIDDTEVVSPREERLFNKIIEKARELFAPIANTNENINQKKVEMKKFKALFTCLAALLSISDDADYNQEEGLLLSDSDLQKLEAGLTSIAEYESKIKDKDEEIRVLNEKLSAITAERDEFKTKYESAPSQTPAVSGSDPVEDCLDNDYYASIERELSLM